MVLVETKVISKNVVTQDIEQNLILEEFYAKALYYDSDAKTIFFNAEKPPVDNEFIINWNIPITHMRRRESRWQGQVEQIETELLSCLRNKQYRDMKTILEVTAELVKEGLNCEDEKMIEVSLMRP